MFLLLIIAAFEAMVVLLSTTNGLGTLPCPVSQLLSIPR
jgi:hypothetical protein